MLTFTQLHIETARNSTDDFNLFHDKLRWNLVPDNPFEGPIALGFQLGCFIETQIDSLRAQDPEIANGKLHEYQFSYSVFELSFAGVVRAQDNISLTLKPGRLKEGEAGSVFSQRLILKANNKPAIIGYKRESQYLPDFVVQNFPKRSEIEGLADRSFTKDGQFFIKHKYMIVGNAKNFLTSAFAEQSAYIDEFEDKVNFPQMYPLGLISSALLERAKADNYDLKAKPMIYVSHKLAIDTRQLQDLNSNDKISIVVTGRQKKENGIGNECEQSCIAYAKADTPLFYGTLILMPLSDIA